MKTTARKPRLVINRLYEVVAYNFAQSDERNPSHCDVRCACNDVLECYERSGYVVPHHYSQDKAYREVLRALRGDSFDGND